MRHWLKYLLCAALLAALSCSRQESPVAADDSEEWDSIKPLADVPTNIPVVVPMKPVPVPVAEDPEPVQARESEPVVEKDVESATPVENVALPEVLPESPTEKAAVGKPFDNVDYEALLKRLKDLTTCERGTNETFIVGDSLVLDYERRFVRLDGNVKVSDDRGQLCAGTLVGRFSESNSVDVVEGEMGVSVASGNRKAVAESGIYSVASGEIRLDGNAEVMQGNNTLSGGRIRFWSRGERKMICEPNAKLVINNLGDLGADSNKFHAISGSFSADRISYDEATYLAVGEGSAELLINKPDDAAVGSNKWYALSGRFVADRMSFNQQTLLAIGQGNAELLINDIGSIGNGLGKLENSDGTLSADRIFYDGQQMAACSKGHTRLRHEQGFMNCEDMTVFLKDGGELDWIMALSEVTIQSGGRRAVGEVAKYFHDEGMFVLEGDPKVSDGRNVMAGERIVFWKNNNQMVCEPRARVVFYPDEKMRQRFLNDMKE